MITTRALPGSRFAPTLAWLVTAAAVFLFATASVADAQQDSMNRLSACAEMTMRRRSSSVTSRAKFGSGRTLRAALMAHASRRLFATARCGARA